MSWPSVSPMSWPFCYRCVGHLCYLCLGIAQEPRPPAILAHHGLAIEAALHGCRRSNLVPNQIRGYCEVLLRPAFAVGFGEELINGLGERELDTETLSQIESQT